MGYYQDLILPISATQTSLYTATPMVQGLLIDTATANTIKLMGGSITLLDDLEIYANAINDYPKISLQGGQGFNFHAGGDADVFRHYFGTTERMRYSYATPDQIIESKVADKNLYLKTNGAGVIKFGTYTAGAATDSTGYITIIDAAGNTRKLMVQA